MFNHSVRAIAEDDEDHIYKLHYHMQPLSSHRTGFRGQMLASWANSGCSLSSSASSILQLLLLFLQHNRLSPELTIAHRSRMNPSHSEIIVDSNLSYNDPKVILNDLIDVHGLRFEPKSRIFKV